MWRVVPSRARAGRPIASSRARRWSSSAGHGGGPASSPGSAATFTTGGGVVGTVGLAECERVSAIAAIALAPRTPTAPIHTTAPLVGGFLPGGGFFRGWLPGTFVSPSRPLKLRPGLRRMRDRVQVARGEALESERVEQARVLSDDDVLSNASYANQLMPKVLDYNSVDVVHKVVVCAVVGDGEGGDTVGGGVL